MESPHISVHDSIDVCAGFAIMYRAIIVVHYSSNDHQTVIHQVFLNEGGVEIAGVI